MLRLIASHEAHAHEEYKRRVIAARESDIARTCIFGPDWPDAPMRVIRKVNPPGWYTESNPRGQIVREMVEEAERVIADRLRSLVSTAKAV
jgi:NAD(P)H-dependent flavin oxidoreductase YrpB (nitropropane dioxygenase family)